MPGYQNSAAHTLFLRNIMKAVQISQNFKTNL